MAKDADRTPTPFTYTHTLPLEMKQSIATCLENLRDHVAKNPGYFSIKGITPLNLAARNTNN